MTSIKRRLNKEEGAGKTSPERNLLSGSLVLTKGTYIESYYAAKVS